MTIDQEKMIGELIGTLQSTDYQELENLAVLAYNKALDDAIEAIRLYVEDNNPSKQSALNPFTVEVYGG